MSNGELSYAVEFARRLPPERFQALFLVTGSGERYVKAYGLEAMALTQTHPEENRLLVDRLIGAYQPDLLVLADVYTAEYSEVWSGINCEYLREYGIPLASFDEYEWGSTGYVVDFYGNARRKFPQLIETCDYLIRPCPLNRIKPVASHIGLTSLFGPEALQIEANSLPDNRTEKVIFTVNSSWEYINVSNNPSLDGLMRWVPRLLAYYLAETGLPLNVVHVGPRPWDLAGITSPLLRYEHHRSLPAPDYNALITEADLFLTTNVVSFTLSKRVFVGAPSIVFHNLRRIPPEVVAKRGANYPPWFNQFIDEVGELYPFRMFPWGWPNFLQPVLSENPYLECFESVPVLDKAAAVAAIATLLTDRSAVAGMRERQAAYAAQTLKLPTPEAILHEWGALIKRG